MLIKPKHLNVLYRGFWLHAFAIGDSDLITGLRLVGVAGAETLTLDEARQALAKALSRKDLALIIISEEFSAKMREEIDNFRATQIAPLIVEIPGHLGPLREAKISELVSRTMGVKI
jgi:vacuolar-type H+-ATPase subunit F/Vma7